MERFGKPVLDPNTVNLGSEWLRGGGGVERGGSASLPRPFSQSCPPTADVLILGGGRACDSLNDCKCDALLLARIEVERKPFRSLPGCAENNQQFEPWVESGPPPPPGTARELGAAHLSHPALHVPCWLLGHGSLINRMLLPNSQQGREEHLPQPPQQTKLPLMVPWRCACWAGGSWE